MSLLRLNTEVDELDEGLLERGCLQSGFRLLSAPPEGVSFREERLDLVRKMVRN